MTGSNTQKTHSACIIERAKAELSGIEEVESFQDSGIVLSSSMGEISIEGENLKIDSFSVESGMISITGSISGLFYYDKAKSAKGGFFARRGR